MRCTQQPKQFEDLQSANSTGTMTVLPLALASRRSGWRGRLKRASWTTCAMD